MKFLTFIPSDYHYKSNNIYLSKSYISLLNGNVKSFCIVDELQKDVLGLIHFQIKKNIAISLANAPFGGLEIYAKLSNNDLERFLAFIMDDFRLHKLEKVVIKMSPFFYSNKRELDFVQLILSSKFKPATKEINHHIDISNYTLESQLHSMEKRKYKKCVNADFVFKREPNTKLSEVYHFIKNCREEKGQSLSMAIEDLQKMIQTFPDSYYLLAAYDDHKMIAATICVKVNNDVIYNFYPASSLEYNKFSPMVFLVANIYRFAQEHKFNTLDLGTSMLYDEYNENLIRFKENISGIKSYREILEHKL